MAVPRAPHVLMIDNYDSFTYNIVQYLGELGATVKVFRNDEISIKNAKSYVETHGITHILVSPGPGAPKDAGISCDIIREFAGVLPIFGVCLGLQCTFEVFGGTVAHAGEIRHGKTSPMTHDGKGVFEGVPSPFSAVRYHSLAGKRDTLPECLEVTCESPGGIIQGIRHKTYVIEGVQFHPESILTEHGYDMLRNFLKMTSATR